MYAPTTLPQKEVEVGAISDPSYLRGRAAAADIFPGQQFTATDFAASDTASVDSQITGIAARDLDLDRQRARLAVAGAGRRLGRRLHRCRRASSSCSRPNVKVLTIPAVPGPSGGSNLVLRIETADAAKWAYAADNTQLDLRPPPGRRREADEAVDANCRYGAEVERNTN